MRNPDWSNAQDLYIVPHRGLWGTDLGVGPPENSISAFQAALDAGYVVAEVDAMNTSDDKLISSHDYPLFRLTNERDENVYVFEKTQAELENLTLVRRDGNLSNEGMASIDAVVELAAENDMILMIDGKEEIGKYVNGVCVAYCGDETVGDGPAEPDYEHTKNTHWFQIINNTMSVARETVFDGNSSLKNIVVKTYLTPDEIINGGTESDSSNTYKGIGDDAMSTVLWTPMVIADHFSGSDSDEVIANMADFVDEWVTYVDRVAYIETDFKNSADDILQPFTRDGVEYANLLVYIRQKANRRGGIFTDEPVGRRGVVTRWAVWKTKDTSTDTRSNHVFTLSPECAQFMAITADSLPTWEEAKNTLFVSGSQKCGN